jgi:hypothetical protein
MAKAKKETTIGTSSAGLTNTSEPTPETTNGMIMYGNDGFKLMSIRVDSEGDMDRVTAMEVKGIGVVIRTQSHIKGSISEASTFVPQSRILEVTGTDGEVTSREIVSLFNLKNK